mmetsp:Transcript_1159/g.4142  ORF Transcript_1159/g.4142 Transcript_1159/m.4142 type:complete len:221 (-) Transcript_1159:462-1124(-)
MRWSASCARSTCSWYWRSSSVGCWCWSSSRSFVTAATSSFCRACTASRRPAPERWKSSTPCATSASNALTAARHAATPSPPPVACSCASRRLCLSTRTSPSSSSRARSSCARWAAVTSPRPALNVRRSRSRRTSARSACACSLRARSDWSCSAARARCSRRSPRMTSSSRPASSSFPRTPCSSTCSWSVSASCCHCCAVPQAGASSSACRRTLISFFTSR